MKISQYNLKGISFKEPLYKFFLFFIQVCIFSLLKAIVLMWAWNLGLLDDVVKSPISFFTAYKISFISSLLLQNNFKIEKHE